VLHDPPFSRLHLVSCRNLLIYLDRSAQKDVLETFHFAMRPGAYLLLGASETVDPSSRLFAPVDKAMRLYRANRSAVVPHAARADAPAPARRPPLRSRSRRPRPGDGDGYDVHRELLEEFAPPTVLANAEGQIVHVSSAPRATCAMPPASRRIRW
jgi:two-component system CheB/CheR fusion protein